MNILQAVALSITPYGRARLAREAAYEQQVMQVMAVLPGKYRYKQIEAAAINAAGVIPNDVHMSLAANEHTFALARFYEVLNGPK